MLVSDSRVSAKATNSRQYEFKRTCHHLMLCATNFLSMNQVTILHRAAYVLTYGL